MLSLEQVYYIDTADRSVRSLRQVQDGLDTVIWKESGSRGRLFARRVPLRHTEADAGLGEDVGRVAGVIAQLAAELADHGVHGPHVAVPR